MRKTTQQILYSIESERDFQQKVVAYAILLGWYVHGVLDTRIPAKRQGQTGFPDLVLARRDRLIFAECKSEKGKPTLAQLEWANMLIGAGQTYYLWKPSMWEEIMRELAGGKNDMPM